MAVKMCYNFCKKQKPLESVVFDSRDSCEDGGKILSCCAEKLSVSTINLLAKCFLYNWASTLILILKGFVMLPFMYENIFYI